MQRIAKYRVGSTRRWLILPLLLVAIVALTGLGTNGTHATAAEASQRLTVIEVPMILDCVNMTDEAREYADERGYCDANTEANPGDATTESISEGDCGTAAFFIDDMPGFTGFADFLLGVTSSKGPITQYSYTTTWWNFSASTWGSWADTVYPFNTSWTDIFTKQPGAGWVGGEMVGTASLAWGGQCIVTPPPFDTTIVT